MALDPNVVVVAPGELITAAHLNNIRSNLDRLDGAMRSERVQLGPGHLKFLPGAAADGGGSAWTDLPAAGIGSATVPTFATAAVLTVSVNGMIATTNGLPVYLFRMDIGGTNSGAGDGIVHFTASLTQRERITFSSLIATPPTGAQLVKLQVSRTGAGTGACRIDTNTLITAHLQYRG